MAKLFVSLKVEKTSRLLRRHPENVPRLGERQHQSGGQRRSENSLSPRRQRSGKGSRGQAARQRPQHPQLHHPPLLAQDKGTAGPPSIVWVISFSFSENVNSRTFFVCFFRWRARSCASQLQQDAPRASVTTGHWSLSSLPRWTTAHRWGSDRLRLMHLKPKSSPKCFFFFNITITL